MSRLSRRALELCCLAAISCADVVGLDDYERVADVRTCADFEVPIRDQCTRIGVPEDACGHGFQSDRRAGCDAILPDGPCLGSLARPGDSSCAPRCKEPLIPPPNAVHVRAGAAEGGTGSLTQPFARIADAIVAVESGSTPTPTIMAAPGEYRENLVVKRPVHLVANCDVLLFADTDQRPAIHIEGPAAALETRIHGFEIVGGSAGIAVHEASSVEISETYLRDTDGPAVIAEASGRSEITLRSVLIESARGAGVAAHGARLSIEDSTIRGTRAAAEGEDSCGVCVRPSGRVWQRDMTVGPDWDARRSNVGSLNLVGSLLEDNARAGVSVIGTADATINGSVIRATADEQATGLDVEERALGNLHTHVVVSQSLVEGTTHTGIRARNAYLDISNTTVRDIRGTADFGTQRCLGNGVRVIWDRRPEAEKPALRLQNSSIESTGVLIHGAHAVIERSLIRDSRDARCAVALRDGIAVYGQEFAPAELVLTATRVEGRTRTSVASFGDATIKLLSSVALGAPIVSRAASNPDGTACADLNAKRWDPCEVQDRRMLASALLGNGRCDARDDTVCIEICSHQVEKTGVGFAPEQRFWIVGHDEIAPVQSDPRGCAEIEGLPRNARVTLGTAVIPEPGFVRIDPRAPLSPLTRAFAPALNQVHTNASDARFAVHVGGQYDYEVLGQIAMESARPGMAPSGLDLRTAPVFAVSICDSTHERRTPMACRALAGVYLSIDRGNLARDPVRDYANSMGTGATAPFVNVLVGPRRFQLLPVDPSRELGCRADTGANWSTATELAENAFEVVARPGYAINTTILCKLGAAKQ